MISPSKRSFAGELDGARLRRALKACPGRPAASVFATHPVEAAIVSPGCSAGPARPESRGDGGALPSSTPHTHVARSRSVAAQGEER